MRELIILEDQKSNLTDGSLERSRDSTFRTACSNRSRKPGNEQNLGTEKPGTETSSRAEAVMARGDAER